jgi:RIO-like serine/threonine protein kinase
MHSRCPIPWIKIKPEMLEVHQQVMYSLQGKLTIQNRDVKKKKNCFNIYYMGIDPVKIRIKHGLIHGEFCNS